jgi:hypothetical protein
LRCASTPAIQTHAPSLEWRILRRYHETDEDAHRYEASVAEDGPDALVVVSPERIIGWDYN